jgi:hypothetical protein
MQFTDEVNWTFMDFFIAGILLFGADLTLETVLRKIKNGFCVIVQNTNLQIP